LQRRHTRVPGTGPLGRCSRSRLFLSCSRAKRANDRSAGQVSALRMYIPELPVKSSLFLTNWYDRISAIRTACYHLPEKIIAFSPVSMNTQPCQDPFPSRHDFELREALIPANCDAGYQVTIDNEESV
jgi:hypothetical protein